MEQLLIICTILGGIAAIIYFWEKIIQWFSIHIKPKKSSLSERDAQNAVSDSSATLPPPNLNYKHNANNKPPHSSTVFFYERFTSAFPGVRGIEWFNRKEAFKRLKLLFVDPIKFQTANSIINPIWEWRGGNLPIDHFEILDRKTLLVNIYELKVARLAAVNMEAYYRCFVYLESDPMEPTGLYQRTPESLQQAARDFGYVVEEYGLYKGKHKVTRAEYDDNSASIRGKIVELGENVKLRARFITPYNLIIAPHSSPINNNEFDSRLDGYMNKILKKESSLDELAEEILRLPKREFEYRT